MTSAIRKLTTIYLVSAALISGFAAISKLVSPADGDRSNSRDRVVRFLTRTQLSYVAIALEISVVSTVALRMRRSPAPALAATIWLAGGIAIYRVALRSAPASDGGCGCFGNIAILGTHTDTVASLSIAYLLLVGSTLCIANLWSRRFQRPCSSLCLRVAQSLQLG